MPEKVHVCSLLESHIDAVLSIESESFPDPWTRRLLLEELSAPHALSLAALQLERVIGYATCWIAADECTLNRIAVLPRDRGQGIAAALLQELFRQAHNRGAGTCHLDVSSANAPAISLYQKMGFRRTGVRRNYYRAGEDAIQMSMPFGNAENA